MTGLVMKLIVCPLTVLAADYFLRNLNYSSLYQPILVGLVIAVGGHLAEVLLLKRGTLWISTIVDFILAIVVVYYSQFFLSGAYVTWPGAAITAAVISVIEAGTHLFLIRSGRTKKHPS